MAKSGGLLNLILRLLGGSSRVEPQRPSAPERPSSPKPPASRPPTTVRSASSATAEVDAHAIRTVRMSYSPVTDGDPDPGEIVWTWVPYEENDGRGKDRPVLVVATESRGSVLAVQLSTKDHRGFLPLGAGGWDSEGRDSFVNLDRVFRVQPAGMRREAVALDRRRFALVADALTRRYGWR